MSEEIVEHTYNKIHAILRFLSDKGEVTFQTDVDNYFRKNFLLTIASYFEDEITKLLIEFTKNKSSNSDELTSFVKNKAIARQYHTYFRWDSRNANYFLGLFGEVFKAQCTKDIDKNEELSNAISAFIEIGETRNNLVHNNFATFPIEKTTEELFNLYKSAINFILYLRTKLPNGSEDAK